MTRTATTAAGPTNVPLAMTYRDRISQSTSIHAAMCVLGEAIDKLIEQNSAEAIVGKTEWEAWRAQPEATPAPAPVCDYCGERDWSYNVAMMRHECRNCESKAYIELDPPLVERRVITTANDREITVDIPAPDPERYAKRLEWATKAKLGKQVSPAMTDEDAAEAYAKGGPLWLYMYDRDAVMSMPVDWRRQFVRDVELDSSKEAYDLGRDILKSEDPQPLGGVPIGEGTWV